MKISNIRLGHANNSSSSHSLIFIPCDDEPTSFDMDIFKGQNFSKYDLDYGWENFELCEPEEKARYFMISYYESLPSSLNERQKYAIMKELFGIEYDKNSQLGYIDHESVGVVSIPSDERLLKRAFDFVVNNPAVSIIGGNDNSVWEYAEDQKEISLNMGTIPAMDHRSYFTWKEEKNWTVFFNKSTGAKTRVYLHTDPNPDPYDKAIVPELVDVKITDWCDTGCAYCYQGSTKEGKHASRQAVMDILANLTKVGVFEVALGGGEPTKWPYFTDIARSYSGCNVNFTTFDMSWAEDNNLSSAIRYGNRIKSFALSNPNRHNLQRLIEWNSKVSSVRGSIQLIEGVHTKEVVDKMVEFLMEQPEMYRPQITILGYKETGRGGEFEKKDSSWMVEFLKDPYEYATPGYKSLRWAVDTSFVQNHPDLFNGEYYPCQVFHKDEGKFSCYIDAVEGKLYKSSYELDNGVSYNKDTFIKEFAKF